MANTNTVGKINKIMPGPTTWLKIQISLANLKFPSHSPLGSLRHTQPIFEDPTRVKGKRDYIAGDSLRRVDWKTTATTGRMHVKLFEPSIALETMTFLDLNIQSYHYRARIDSTELAIVIAASISNWIIDKGQTVGLYTNGEDPLAVDGRAQVLPSRNGRAHLIRVLETLARIRTSDAQDVLATQIQNHRVHLPWGTTLIIITGSVGDALLNELFQARRSGQNAIIIISGRAVGVKEIQSRAGYFGIPVVPIANESDLERWGHGRILTS